ncbi:MULTISPECIES: hypothetical protein [Kamptonema]|nr:MULTISPECIES: hypothetical protein [Kamptonema]
MNASSGISSQTNILVSLSLSWDKPAIVALADAIAHKILYLT